MQFVLNGAPYMKNIDERDALENDNKNNRRR